MKRGLQQILRPSLFYREVEVGGAYVLLLITTNRPDTPLAPRAL